MAEPGEPPPAGSHIKGLDGRTVNTLRHFMAQGLSMIQIQGPDTVLQEWVVRRARGGPWWLRWEWDVAYFGSLYVAGPARRIFG